ncbi:uncharacterized protein LOC129953914 [Eupeodes corollae]|uniref:uncharacterized protein LOC129953914 n=1 Tax=Eupeodes corollae TaxID=290404 RepID=UPI00248F4BDF|nr:uncharacterized protein LOC129953914 [Eupeodes corollae]
MASPRNTRIALSEIPDRLELLRVATTPTNPEAAEPTPANILNQTIFDNAINNMSLDHESPVASPDEIVIKQRGRRRFTLTWSPDKLSSQSPFQKTPTKIATHMTLRSSPRKRLLMTETPYSKSPSADSCASDNIGRLSGFRSPCNMTPIVKKLKLDETPVAQTNFNTSLDVMLKGLSHNQLVEMIGHLVAKDAKLEEVIRSDFPLPDIGYLEDELILCKRNIFKSLPTSRLCKKTDSSAYAKAVMHVSAFKTAIISHTRKLHDSSHWDALLDYALMAWNYVRATPIWDNNSHNAIRRQCFKILTCHCVAALKHGGLRVGVQRLNNLERNLADWSKDHEDVLSCVNALNKTFNFRSSM